MGHTISLFSYVHTSSAYMRKKCSHFDVLEEILGEKRAIVVPFLKNSLNKTGPYEITSICTNNNVTEENITVQIGSNVRIQGFNEINTTEAYQNLALYFYYNFTVQQ